MQEDEEERETNVAKTRKVRRLEKRREKGNGCWIRIESKDG